MSNEGLAEKLSKLQSKVQVFEALSIATLVILLLLLPCTPPGRRFIVWIGTGHTNKMPPNEDVERGIELSTPPETTPVQEADHCAPDNREADYQGNQMPDCSLQRQPGIRFKENPLQRRRIMSDANQYYPQMSMSNGEPAATAEMLLDKPIAVDAVDKPGQSFEWDHHMYPGQRPRFVTRPATAAGTCRPLSFIEEEPRLDISSSRTRWPSPPLSENPPVEIPVQVIPRTDSGEGKRPASLKRVETHLPEKRLASSAEGDKERVTESKPAERTRMSRAQRMMERYEENPRPVGYDSDTGKYYY